MIARVIAQHNIQLVHDHGVWHPANIVSATAAAWYNRPLVVTPRGMLTPWALAHKRIKKQLAWHTYQWWIIKQADLLHATAPSEVEDLRALGLTQPIAVIPNGVTLPDLPTAPPPNDASKHTALFLSRVHPKKGLPMLLEAWATVAPSKWELVIAGPSEEGHRKELEQLAHKLGIQNAVQFIGPVPDSKKWGWYRQADLFVLPTHSENFGVVVAEALACEVPVITTTGAPWKALETYECGWWTDISAEALAAALKEATGLTPVQRRLMGRKGRKLIHDEYSWAEIGQKLQATYQWLLSGSAAPPWLDRA